MYHSVLLNDAVESVWKPGFRYVRSKGVCSVNTILSDSFLRMRLFWYTMTVSLLLLSRPSLLSVPVGGWESNQYILYTQKERKMRLNLCFNINWCWNNSGLGHITFLRFHGHSFPVIATRRDLTSEFLVLWLFKPPPTPLQCCLSLRCRSCVLVVGLGTLPSVALLILTRCGLQ